MEINKSNLTECLGNFCHESKKRGVELDLRDMSILTNLVQYIITEHYKSEGLTIAEIFNWEFFQNNVQVSGFTGIQNDCKKKTGFQENKNKNERVYGGFRGGKTMQHEIDKKIKEHLDDLKFLDEYAAGLHRGEDRVNPNEKSNDLIDKMIKESSD